MFEAIAIGALIVSGIGGLIGVGKGLSDKKKEEENKKLELQQIEESKALKADAYAKEWGGEVYKRDANGNRIMVTDLSEENFGEYITETVEGTQVKKYKEEAKKATEEADLNDKQLTLSEGYLSDEYNNVLAQLGLAQSNQSMQNQYTQLSDASNIGDALAAQGLSGTRGSSVMGALERQEAYQNNTFAYNRNAAEMAFNYQLNNQILGMNQNRDVLTFNRDANNRSRNSWLEGGYNYNVFQLAKESANTNWQTQTTAADLQKTFVKKSYDINKMNGWDVLASGFNGASTGLSLYKTGRELWENF